MTDDELERLQPLAERPTGPRWAMNVAQGLMVVAIGVVFVSVALLLWALVFGCPPPFDWFGWC